MIGHVIITENQVTTLTNINTTLPNGKATFKKKQEKIYRRK